MIRGRRPSFLANSSVSAHAFSKSASFLLSLLYTPEIVLITALYRPTISSQASLISPRVARCPAAMTARLSRFSLLFFPSLNSRTHSVMAARSFFTCSLSRLARSFLSDSSCSRRTAVLSISRMSMGSSWSRRYLFTPTMVCTPESMRACVRAAASSMRILGKPVSMAFAIPPSFSISCMCSQALWYNSCVSFST